MKLYIDDKKRLLVEKKYTITKFEMQEIRKIYIDYTSFLFLKIYTLSILTHHGKKVTFNFFKKDKDAIKRAVFFINNQINWEQSL